MKKLISLTLIFILILALGATAFADNYGITITKNPTDETRTAGGTAWFVSGATNYSSIDWTFVSPSGMEYTVQEFLKEFPYVTVEGEYTTTLTVRNLSTELNGWAVFCNFHSANDNARTAWAFFYVSAYVAPSYSTPNYYIPYGATDGGYSYDENGNLEYDVYYDDGHYTTFYWDGSSLTNFLDGSYMYQSNDGRVSAFNDNGSYFDYSPDGSWNSYDAATDSYSGGVFYN